MPKKNQLDIKVKKQIILYSGILLLFVCLIIFFAVRYRQSVESGLIAERLMEENISQISDFVLENKEYIFDSEARQELPPEQRRTIQDKAQNLFFDYLSSFIFAFPKDQEDGIREIYCYLSSESKAKSPFDLNFACENLEEASFKTNDYFIISIALNDVMEKLNYSKEAVYNFCGLVEPLIEEPVFKEGFKGDFFVKNFNEGRLICLEGVNLNFPRAFVFSGIVPLEEKMKLSIYLVNNESLEKIKIENQFSNLLLALDKNNLIWSKKK